MTPREDKESSTFRIHSYTPYSSFSLTGGDTKRAKRTREPMKTSWARRGERAIHSFVSTE